MMVSYHHSEGDGKLPQNVDPKSVNFKVDKSKIVGRPISNYSRYVVRELVGYGGMGTVFRATDSNITDHEVAVKFFGSKILEQMSYDWQKAEYVQRFLGEIKAMVESNTLPCENLIEVYDAGITRNNNLYFVMDYIKGGVTLADVLSFREGNFDLDEVCVIEAQLLNALASAHRYKIVNRDVKPDNIMFDYIHKVIKLTDFGVFFDNKRVGDVYTQIKQDTPGTIPYLSKFQIKRPEIPIDPMKDKVFEEGGKRYCEIKGKRFEVSERHGGELYVDFIPEQSDTQVALGSLFYEILTGRRRFMGKVDDKVKDEIRDSTARDLFVDRSGRYPRSSPMLKGLSRSSIRGINRIFSLFWRYDLTKIPSAEEGRERIYGLLDGRINENGTVEKIISKTDEACDRKIKEMIRGINDDEYPTHEWDKQEFTRRLSFIKKRKGVEMEGGEILNALKNSSKRMVSNLEGKLKTMTRSELENARDKLETNKNAWTELEKGELPKEYKDITKTTARKILQIDTKLKNG